MGLFFFSSRRRHTRFDCDWSSDVCSSDLWRKLCPCIIRACPRAGTASQESSQSQISEAEAKWIRGKAEEIWLVLIIDGIPGIQRQAEVSRAEAGEHGTRIRDRASVFTVWKCAVGRRRRGRSGPAVEMAGVAIAFAAKEVVAGHFVRSKRIRFDGPGEVRQVDVELRRKSADIR